MRKFTRQFHIIPETAAFENSRQMEETSGRNQNGLYYCIAVYDENLNDGRRCSWYEMPNWLMIDWLSLRRTMNDEDKREIRGDDDNSSIFNVPLPVLYTACHIPWWWATQRESVRHPEVVNKPFWLFNKSTRENWHNNRSRLKSSCNVHLPQGICSRLTSTEFIPGQPNYQSASAASLELQFVDVAFKLTLLPAAGGAYSPLCLPCVQQT